MFKIRSGNAASSVGLSAPYLVWWAYRPSLLFED